jgi:hypothetical protein
MIEFVRILAHRGMVISVGMASNLEDKFQLVSACVTARPLNWRERGRKREKVSQRFSLF